MSDPEYQKPPVEDPAVVERRHGSVRAARTVGAVIRAVCGLFALVLAIHIVLVIGEANPQNGFAQLINNWTSGVSLGLRDLFTLDNLKVRTLCNDGLAAILWLVIGEVAAGLVSRITSPGPGPVWTRRLTR